MPGETFARIDVDALGRNLTAIRRHVGGRKILLPVKANAYGHGLVEVARAVEENGWAEWLGVAAVDEGIALREAGITLPVLKLSPAHADDVARAVAAGVTLTVEDAETISAVASAGSAESPANVHLKVDTGMRRIGCEPGEAAGLARLIATDPRLALGGVFTHLAASEDEHEDEFTARQLKLFRGAVAAIEDATGEAIPLVHAANSGGVLRHPDSWFDLVRPGILSYGYIPGAESRRRSLGEWLGLDDEAGGAQPRPTDESSDAPGTPPHDHADSSGVGGDRAELVTAIEPVLTLVSHLSYVKVVPAGQTVSYNRRWRARRDTWIGTIPVGYGDGYRRGLTNEGEVVIRGRRHRVTGTVCMDQLMVDLGPATGAADEQPPYQAGEAVVLIGSDGGERVGADDLGRICETISYEILTGLAARVPRVVVRSAHRPVV
ncbi:MAG: alanine racemase [Propionibacteriaceae bacterium]|jgi:alanine racemase|nr:alanine racemase [Propionibacteriaceae bacterium]